ncbi:MAG TPA: low temperature requirement protein A [Solirubrobacterales bacterium]|nr:low temperature requirement protein A [Solirubrobacterales bacterium]
MAAMASVAETRRSRVAAVMREGERVTPLELFFDLVFVLALTQCTALMAHEPTWAGLARGMLVLGVLWWTWVGYSWLTSVVDPEEGAVRGAMFAAMAGLLIISLCVPRAFGEEALVFALAYGVVRAGQIALFTIASRDDDALRHSVNGLAVGTAVGVTLLAVSSAFDGFAQGAIWALALALDVSAPYFFVDPSGWKLAPGHFAERHGLILIVALGESIVAIGVAADLGLDAGVVAAAVLGIALAAALWWIYFDVVALVAGRRLAEAEPGLVQNEMARDSYSYLHFPMLAGIVLVALALKKTLAHVGDPLEVVPAFALLGGLAAYLLGHVAFRYRHIHTINWRRLILAVVLLALLPLAVELPALAVLAIVTALVWALIAYETHAYGESRTRLRHEARAEI